MVSLKKNFQLLTSQKKKTQQTKTEAQLFINRKHTGISKCQLLFQDLTSSTTSPPPRSPVTFMCCNCCLLTNSDLTPLVPSSPIKVFRESLHLTCLSLNWFLIKSITYSVNKYLLYFCQFLNTMLAVNIPDQVPILTGHSRCRMKRTGKW